MAATVTPVDFLDLLQKIYLGVLLSLGRPISVLRMVRLSDQPNFITKRTGTRCVPSRDGYQWDSWYVFITSDERVAFVHPYQVGGRTLFEASGPTGEWNNDLNTEELRISLRRFICAEI